MMTFGKSQLYNVLILDLLKLSCPLYILSDPTNTPSPPSMFTNIFQKLFQISFYVKFLSFIGTEL